MPSQCEEAQYFVIPAITLSNSIISTDQLLIPPVASVSIEFPRHISLDLTMLLYHADVWSPTSHVDEFLSKLKLSLASRPIGIPVRSFRALQRMSVGFLLP